MADDLPFYAPNRPPRPSRQPKPTEPLLEVTVGGVRWSAVLMSHGEWGSEARIVRNGELAWSRRFPFREEAIGWAESERRDVERDLKV